VHNLIVCTPCSCYPWPTLGLPPYWYKDPTFRVVLEEFGVKLASLVEIRVWNSSAQIRWFVMPQRPDGTEGLSEDELAKLVTPEAMMGVAKVPSPSPSAS
jgi:nitrile hydratase subunit alpha